MSGIIIEENISPPDLISESGPELNVSHPLCPVNKEILHEPETSDALPEWKGVSLEEIYKGRGSFEFQELPQIYPSATHTVLFDLPLPKYGFPESHLSKTNDKWVPGFVKMPHSSHSLYSTEKLTKSGKEIHENRWELIRKALQQYFKSTVQLESAILTYNPESAKKWKFKVLHYYFDKVVDQEEKEEFFKILLPKIIDLALQLPILISGPIPLLEKYSNASISLSQFQAASIVANAFLCTFPKRPESESKNYNEINFNKIFCAKLGEKHIKLPMMLEKIRFILNYLKRVTTKMPAGTLTIQRRYIAEENCPKWSQESKKLPFLHITSKGRIEDEGASFLKVDFADKYIGGMLLGIGCVQEEIMFLLYPELIVTMLVTEVLDDTEAVIISGVERFNRYEGYFNSLKWAGDFIDETPRDESKRRKSSFVAIDATAFKIPEAQYQISSISRELNKAFAGFCGGEINSNDLPAIATGNWGCGVFKGDPKLKALLQLMAAGISERSVIYFTFRDEALRDSISEIYWHLVEHNVTIGQLFGLLSEFSECDLNYQDLYSFLYEKIK